MRHCFLYLAASAEAVSMVLVTERMEQARQGDTRVSPAKDGEPDPGHRGPSASPLPEGPDPEQGGPEEPRSRGNPEPLGARGPDVVDKGEPDPVTRVRTIQNQSTTSAKSSTRQRPGILRRISLSMPYLLRPENLTSCYCSGNLTDVSSV